MPKIFTRAEPGAVVAIRGVDASGLAAYLNEYVWRYNYRYDDTTVFLPGSKPLKLA